MLLLIGAGLIGLTLSILLALIVVSQLTGGRWPADAVVAERVTLSLIVGFVSGLVCVALDQSGADPPSRRETLLLLITLGGFALLAPWFRPGASARADAPGPPASGASPYASGGPARVVRPSRQRST